MATSTLLAIVASLCTNACCTLEASAGKLFTDDFSDGMLEDDSPVSWIPGGAPQGTRDASSGDLVQTPLAPGNSMSTFVTLGDVSQIYGAVSLTTQLRVHDSFGNWASLFSRSLGDPDATLFGAIKPSGRGARAEVTFAANFDGQTRFFSRQIIPLDVFNRDAMLRFDVRGNRMKLWAWDPDLPQPIEPTIAAEVPAGFPRMTGTIGVLNFHATTFRFVEAIQIPEPGTSALISAVFLFATLHRFEKR